MGMLLFLVFIPALIGLANRSGQAILKGAFFSVLSGIAALTLQIWIGVAVWLFGCAYVTWTVSQIRARRDDERRHRELLAAISSTTSQNVQQAPLSQPSQAFVRDEYAPAMPPPRRGVW